MSGFWCGAHLLLQRAVAGEAEALAPLGEALDAAPTELLLRLPHAPRNPRERALVDGAGEHRGQRLEQLGRQVVLALAEQLDLSELACWDHLLAASTAGGLEPPSTLAYVNEGVPAAEAMAERAAALYVRERGCMLLLLLDCLKLASTAADGLDDDGDGESASAGRAFTPTRAAVTRFVAALQRVPVPGSPAGASLTFTLLTAVEALARACAAGAAAAYDCADAPSGPFGAAGGMAMEDGPAAALRLEGKRKVRGMPGFAAAVPFLMPRRPPI